MTKLIQVSDAIMRSIASGSMREGDRLPSEGQLATAHGVSVGTVQKALIRLCQTGLIKRQQGRGTFVSDAAAPADLRHLRFRDRGGKAVSFHAFTRSAKRTRRKGPWSDFLGEGQYVRIERGVNIGGSFDLYSECWLREEDVAQLGGTEQEAAERNLRELIGRKLSLPTPRVDQWMRFSLPPAMVANELGLDPEQPAIAMETQGYTMGDQPLYYQAVYCAPFPERLMIVWEKSA
ncbi:GntR family transcriptional regulator [Cupriavidus sp. CP313]